MLLTLAFSISYFLVFGLAHISPRKNRDLKTYWEFLFRINGQGNEKQQQEIGSRGKQAAESKKVITS